MAAVPVNSLDNAQKAQLCCTYASLILHDEGFPYSYSGLEITAPQLKKLIEASGNKIEGFWAGIFAKALTGQNVKDLLLGGGAAQPSAGTGSSAQTGGAPAKGSVFPNGRRAKG